MIAENNEVPVCKEHSSKITVCSPCQGLLSAHWDVMPKRVPQPYKPEAETLDDFYFRERKVHEDNQAALHQWAVVNVYVDPLENVEVPF